MVAVVELRCERHLHGIAVGDVIEVRCRECAKRLGLPEVIHRWRMTPQGAVMMDEGEGPELVGTLTTLSGSRDPTARKACQ